MGDVNLTCPECGVTHDTNSAILLQPDRAICTDSGHEVSTGDEQSAPASSATSSAAGPEAPRASAGEIAALADVASGELGDTGAAPQNAAADAARHAPGAAPDAHSARTAAEPTDGPDADSDAHDTVVHPFDPSLLDDNQTPAAADASEQQPVSELSREQEVAVLSELASAPLEDAALGAETTALASNHTDAAPVTDVAEGAGLEPAPQPTAAASDGPEMEEAAPVTDVAEAAGLEPAPQANANESTGVAGSETVMQLEPETAEAPSRSETIEHHGSAAELAAPESPMAAAQAPQAGQQALWSEGDSSDAAGHPKPEPGPADPPAAVHVDANMDPGELPTSEINVDALHEHLQEMEDTSSMVTSKPPGPDGQGNEDAGVAAAPVGLRWNVAAVVAAGTLVLGAFLGWLVASPDAAPAAAETKYVAERSILWAGPAEDAGYRVGAIERGARVSVLDAASAFALVRDELGRVGYVKAGALGTSAPPNGGERMFVGCTRAPGEPDAEACRARAERRRDVCESRCAEAEADCREACAERFQACIADGCGTPATEREPDAAAAHQGGATPSSATKQADTRADAGVAPAAEAKKGSESDAKAAADKRQRGPSARKNTKAKGVRRGRRGPKERGRLERGPKKRRRGMQKAPKRRRRLQRQKAKRRKMKRRRMRRRQQRRQKGRPDKKQ